MSMEIWSTCNGCEESITDIESASFGGRCQSCYLGISKRGVSIGTPYYTLMSAVAKQRNGKHVVEANIAIPNIGVVEVIIGVGEKGLQAIEIPATVSNGSLLTIRVLVDELIDSCIDFVEVVETLRTNSIG
jgi:hypothetical protein